MGILVSILRNDRLGDCTNGGFSAKADTACLVNAEGPFEPSEEFPAVRLVAGPTGLPILEPVDGPEGKWQMFGGNHAYSSDGRFRDAIATVCGETAARYSQAIAIHDRFDEWR